MARLPIRPVAPVLAIATLAACSATATEPSALLLGAGHEAARVVLALLPTLPRLLNDGHGPRNAGREGSPADTVLLAARAMWVASERAADAAESAGLREAAIGLAAPVLAEWLDSAAMARSLYELERWLAAAEAVAGGVDLVGIRAALDAGRGELHAARDAMSAHDSTAAVSALLRAADALDRTTPRSVAARLIGSAEVNLARILADSPRRAADETLQRADRLIRGAREALAEGDHALAIRRAYYANQLLDLR